ncbi:hypothetical protein BN2476_360045 [Paraburkholderia piptadeniae]|uniref:Uncharacterized protein n=1 Tax=Paraburkholderia piptadeniae TaxID=1701573 RepID=A0A1N7S969_9BURK|nr:hypothetical protein BN2476_360045 [Paraburkholderia piptadeniae]
MTGGTFDITPFRRKTTSFVSLIIGVGVNGSTSINFSLFNGQHSLTPTTRRIIQLVTRRLGRSMAEFDGR